MKSRQVAGRNYTQRARGRSINAGPSRTVWVPPFDTLALPYADWSLARVRTAFASPIVRLRRSSDDAELDFTPLADGWLDQVAISNWRGVGDAFIARWYDQTGNNRHANQVSNPTKQAKLSVNCRRAIFDGVNDDYVIANFAGYGRNSPGYTMAALSNIDDGVTNRVLMQVNTPVPNTRMRILRMATTDRMTTQSRGLDAVAADTTNAAVGTGTGWKRVIGRRDNIGLISSCVVDGAIVDTVAAGVSGNSSDTDNLGAWLGSGGTSDYLIGQASYFGALNVSLSNAEIAAVDAALAQIQARL